MKFSQYNSPLRPSSGKASEESTLKFLEAFVESMATGKPMKLEGGAVRYFDDAPDMKRQDALAKNTSKLRVVSTKYKVSLTIGAPDGADLPFQALGFNDGALQEIIDRVQKRKAELATPAPPTPATKKAPAAKKAPATPAT